MTVSRARSRSLVGIWGFVLSLALVVIGQAPLANAVAPPLPPAVTANLPTMDITLANGVSLSTVNGGSKDTIYPSTVTITDPGGAYNLNSDPAAAAEFKGRGNYTWNLPKKPYQVKFNNSTSILGMPSAKAWVLLANDADGSLMRNKLMYDFAASIGLAYSSESRWVDLRVNGKYVGNYLVAEKVEVKKNRVDLSDPQAILAEMDNNYGYAEDYNFITAPSKSTWVLKDAKSALPDKNVAPLPADTAAGWADMKNTLATLDSILNSPNPDWNTISSMIDVPSFVKFYFVYEMAENPEIVASSIFFYKNGPTSKLYAGPVWDFDSSVGTFDHTESLGAFTNAEYVKNADQLRLRGNNWYRNLYRMPQFAALANDAWQNGGVGYAASQLPNKLAQYKAQIAGSAANNFNVWRVLGTPTHLVAGEGRAYSSTYDGEVSYLNNWVTARYNHLKKDNGDVPLLRYQGHSQGLGWLPNVNNGQIGGTVNQAKWLEAVNYALSGANVSGTVEANGHVSNIGWMGWKTGQFGTTGRGLPLEAFQMRLTGALATKYDISYRAHVRNVGWQPWVTNGATAGTTGQATPIEAVMIRLLLKNPANPNPGPSPTATPTPTVTPTTASPTPTATTASPTATPTPTVTPTTASPTPTATTASPTATPTPTVTPTTASPTPTATTASPTPTTTTPPAATAGTAYSAHVATIGWMATVTNDAVAGTTGRGLPMEALRLKISNPDVAGDISYRGHVSTIGWQSWVDSSTYIGTSGRALNLEAFQITLTGQLATKYSIQYRAHVSGIGWQPYVADGVTAGTTGQARAVEAVQIRLVPKS